MIEFILICFAASLCVVTLHNLFSDPQSIIGSVPFYIEKTFLRKFRKPLYDCLVCMSSFWGTVFFCLICFLFDYKINFLSVLIAVLVIAGMNIMRAAWLQIAEFLYHKAEAEM